jgi:predicted MFS family arabinose efflux permease
MLATVMAKSRVAGRLHYAWIVAAVTFVTLLGSSGFRSTPGVLIVPLEHEFGWSRATISLAVSINLILFGLIGPFAAGLMERFGVRRVVMTALLLVATGSGLTVLIHAPWQLDALWGVVVGTGTGSMASVLAATVANRWFVKRRGLVLGALTAAGATGQLVFLPLLAWLAVNQGWRFASLAVAGAALLVLPLVFFFLRNRPADVGLAAYGGSGQEAGAAPTGNAFRAAFSGLALGLRSRDFWLLAGSFFICGASTNGLIGTHLIPASIDHGMPEVTAATLLATIGVFDVVGTTVSGVLTDRFDSRWLLFWYYGLRGLSLLFLPFAFGLQYFGLALFIVFYGLDWVATVPPTVQLARRVFGPEKMTIVYGWIFAAHQLGAASVAFAAGAMRTYFGDYQLAFMTSGMLCLVAAGMVIRISRSRGEPGRQLAETPVAA